MLTKNNTGEKIILNRLYKSNKIKNIYIFIAVFFTAILFTGVFSVGVGVLETLKKFYIENPDTYVNNISAVIPYIFGIILVMFSGYLIIYNIFYISIIKDIKLYGQLKTIGTTYKQIKKIIYKWAMKISMFAITFGFIIGGVLGMFLTPIILRETFIEDYFKYNFNVIPFILAFIFTILTVYISVSKPAKIAGKITAIEALNYNSTDTIKSNKRRGKTTNRAKIRNMAFANIMKSKTKVILSVLSISISSTLVIFAVLVSFGLDIEEHAKRYVREDISITKSHFDYENQTAKKVTQKDIEKILTDPRVKNYDITKTLIQKTVLGDSESQMIVSNDILDKEFDSYKEGYGMTNNKSSFNTYSVKINGLTAQALEQNVNRVKVLEGKINEKKFADGNFIIINRGENEVANGLKAGEKIELKFLIMNEDGSTKEIKRNFTIMAIVADKDKNYTATNFGIINMSLSKFEELFDESVKTVTSIDIETDAKNIDTLNEDLNKMFKEYGLNGMTKKYYEEGVKNLKDSIVLASGIVAIIFGIIAIVNILNVTISDLLMRKRELAMLHAIGMTKKEQRKLLRIEGVYKLVLIALFIIPLGLIVGFLAPQMIPIYGGFNLMVYIITIISVLIVLGVIVILIPQFILKGIINNESIIEMMKED